jgi:thiosulfate/3-mercaptopyruvate sulfurtransferase
MRPLIDVLELARLLDSADVTLLDVRWSLGQTTGHDVYLDGHLPGAVYVDLDTELAAPASERGRHPLPADEVFAEAMARAGVTPDRQVVAYDDGSGLGASRLWWMLTDAGHPAVRVLNGGYAAWVAARQPVEPGEVTGVRGTFRATPGHRPVVDAAGLARHLRDGGALYDVRAADRYRGENETVDPVAGHIPGASSLPYASLTAGGGFASSEELLTTMANVRPGDVFSCGSGVTAAAAILAGEQAGIEGLVLYPGSWSEWIADPSRPVATGSERGRPPVS